MRSLFKEPNEHDRLPNGRFVPISTFGLDYIEENSVPEPNTGCWLWLLHIDHRGYGLISKKVFGENMAHRYALISAIGPIGDFLALHRCDQPGCVNPDHLFPGSQADNMQDMIRKRRKSRIVLTADAVRSIRARKSEEPKALSDEFGVTVSTIYQVWRRHSWSNIA